MCPIKGSAPAILSVAGGHVALAIVPFPPDFLPLQDSLRILAQTGSGIGTEGWAGIFAPRKHHQKKSPDLPRFSGKRPSGPGKDCELSDLSRYGDPVLRHERCMRKITHSGSRYLRYSVFNPDKTERRPAIERLRASHRALRGDVDLVSLPEFDQASFIATRLHRPWLLVPAVVSSDLSVSGVASAAVAANAGQQSLPNMGRKRWRSA